MANSEAESAFEDYAKIVGISDDPYTMKLDLNHYNMGERLKLAGKVKSDLESNKGKRASLVVELGSESGGMSYALMRNGLKVLSVENDFENYLVSKLVNENTVQEDAFTYRPDEAAGAVVSYMFLGACMPKADGNNRAETVRKTFDSLADSYNTDTIYCVELERELYGWFGEHHALNEKEITAKLKETLKGWDVEPLGNFGVFVSSDDDIEDRLGFRFTKKRGPINER